MRSRSASAQPFSLFAFQDIITSVSGIMILVTLLLGLELMRRQEATPAASTDTTLEELERQLEQLRNRVDQKASQAAQMAELLSSDAVKDPATLQAFLETAQQESATIQADVARLKSRQQRLEQSRQRLDRESQSPELNAQLQKSQQELEQKQARLNRIRSANRVVFEPAPGMEGRSWVAQCDGKRYLVARMQESAPPQIFTQLVDVDGWLRTLTPAQDFVLVLIQPNGEEMSRELRERLLNGGYKHGYEMIRDDQSAVDPETGASL